MKWPREHRALVDELLAEYRQDDEALRTALALLGLKTVAASREVDRAVVREAHDLRRFRTKPSVTRQLMTELPEDDTPDGEVMPTAVEVVESCAGPLGLGVRSVVEGRPTSAVLFATKGPVVIGEEEDTRVVVDKQGVRAVIRSQLARGRSGSAVFTVAARDLRRRYEFAPEGHDLLVFVLRSESRAFVMTRGEVRDVHEALETGRKLNRFSLAADGTLRVSMPKKPTGLDMAFPRVAKWEGPE